jgi:hypothetical protein
MISPQRGHRFISRNLHNSQQIDPSRVHRRHGHMVEVMEVKIREPGVMIGAGKRAANALYWLTMAVKYQAKSTAHW